MAFEITKDLLQEIKNLVETKDSDKIKTLFNDLHFADLAEIFTDTVRHNDGVIQ